MKASLIAQDCFTKVITGKQYDLEKAQQHFKDSGLFDLSIPSALEEIINFVNKEKVGGCVHFSLYLTTLLCKNNINSRCATIPTEGSDGKRSLLHCCVWLELDEKEYISDPVEAVKAITNGNYPSEHFLVPLHEFVDKNLRTGECLKIYSPLQENTVSLNEFFKNPEAQFVC